MSDSPKRPPTSGTRRGSGKGKSGDGWGGPANGTGSVAAAHAQFEAGNSVAKGYHDMSRLERLAALDERKWQIAMGQTATETVALMALNSYEDRHLGKAKQALTIGGEQDGAPLKNEIIITYRTPVAQTD